MKPKFISSLIIFALCTLGILYNLKAEPNLHGEFTGTISNPLDSMPSGFSYLTTSTCASGYTAVEDGFIQLGSSPNTTPTGDGKIVADNLPTHTHSIGGNTGNPTTNPTHSHGAGSYKVSPYYINYLEGSGGLAQLLKRDVPGTSGTQDFSVSGISDPEPIDNHLHSLPSNTGNNTTANTAYEPRKVVLRLCVKS